MMTITEARKVCHDIEIALDGKAWNDIYSTETELIEDLYLVYIPKSRTAPGGTFKGYNYIYSFAYYAKQGWKLSPKQMGQAKRLAKEIKKAALISEYIF